MKLKLPLPLFAAVMAAFLSLPSPAADHEEINQGAVIYTGQSADYHGGAIDADNVILSDNESVTFSENSANIFGGAIRAQGNVTLSGNEAVTFRSNSAASNGGAIFADYTVTLSGNGDISFSDNKSTDANSGAIYSEYGEIILSDNIGTISFSRNTADHHGGAILTELAITLSNNAGSISFSSNHALQGFGGAICSYYEQVTMTGNQDISFSDNSALYEGGAIFASKDVVLSNNGSITFTGNSARTGGAINSNYAQVILSNNTGAISFSRNTSDSQGGAIFAGSDVTLSDNKAVIFTGNSADNGGAIYAGSNVTLSGNEAVTFTGNSAASYGGAIYAASNVTLSDNGFVTFTGNSADNGGAIYAGSNVMLSDNEAVTFTGNSAASEGGAIYAESNGNVTLSGNEAVTFRSNSADSGGAISAANVTLSGNEAVTFRSNSAVTHGGAISSRNVTLSGNEAVTFTGNSAAIYGGAICAGGNVMLSGNEAVTFTGNSAIIGGAIYGGNDVMLSGNEVVTFTGNSAASYGGGAISSRNVTLSGNEAISFSRNTSDSQGGAIGAIFTGSNVMLSDNEAVTFTGNSAASYGGAIYAASNVMLSGNEVVTFTGNSANVGGAIYAGGDVTLSGNGAVSFENNRGGAIVTEGGNITLSGNGSIRLTGNTIDGSLDESMNAGGAVTMKGGRLLLSADAGDVMFSGNRVTTAAGDVMRAIGLNAGEDAEGNALPASMELQAAAGRTITFHEGIAAGNALLAANMQEGSTGAIVFSGLSASLLERLTGETDEAFAARVQASRTFRLEEAAVGNGTLVVREKALLDANRLALSGSALLDVREDSTVHAGEWNVGDNASFILHSGASLRSDSGTLSLASGVGIDVGSILTGASGKAARFDASNVVLGGTLVLKDAGGQLYTATDAMAQDRKVELAHDVQGSRNGSDFSGLVAEVSEYGYKGTWTAGWEGDTLIGQWTAEQVFQPWDEFRGGAVYNSLWSTASNAQALSGAVRDQSGSPRLLSERKSNVWFSGLGDFGMQRSAGQADGYDYQGGGYALGGDYKLTANHVLGAAFGQMSGRNTSRSYFAHNRQNSLMGAVYGAGLVDMQKHGRLRYNLTAAYGNTSNSIRMYDSLLNRSTTGKWDNTAWELDGRIAWDIALNRTWTASPFIGLEYTAASSDAFTESGENPRHFGKGRLENLSMPVGVSISRSDSVGKGMVWENALSLSYAPDVYRHNPRGTVSMPHTVQGWSTRGVDVGRHAGVFDYTTGLQIDENWRTYAGYTLEIRKDAVLQTARAGVGYSF